MYLYCLHVQMYMSHEYQEESCDYQGWSCDYQDSHVTTKDSHVTTKDDHVTTKDSHVTTKDSLVTTKESHVIIPLISSWWDVTTETFQAMFLSTLHSLPSSTTIMLATSECPWGELPAALREMFEGVRNECTCIPPWSRESSFLPCPPHTTRTTPTPQTTAM